MKNLLSLLSLLIVTSGLSGQPLASALSDAAANGDGSYTNWFGTFSPEGGTLTNAGWVEHAEHGRIYLSAFGQHLWIYDPNAEAVGAGIHGWIYTNRTFFPYFYVGGVPPTFLYFVSGATGPEGQRVFVNLLAAENVYLSSRTTSTIVEIAVASGSFNSLVAAVSTAGLVEALSGPGPFTVFAPTDAAFAALDPVLLNDLLTKPENLGTLTSILTYHVVAGRLPSASLGLDLGAILRGEYISGYVQTLGGADLRVDVTPFGVMLNGNTMVTTPDIECSNGVIHVIDKVLLPPKDIVDTAVDAGFATLVAAVKAAGLESNLRGAGPFTVFAPTEAAFAALGTETINTLLANPTVLADILAYHVVGAKVYSSEVAPGEVTMVNGDKATLSVGAGGGLMINSANITVTDVLASNGVIHVIDAVILPPSE